MASVPGAGLARALLQFRPGPGVGFAAVRRERVGCPELPFFEEVHRRLCMASLLPRKVSEVAEDPWPNGFAAQPRKLYIRVRRDHEVPPWFASLLPEPEAPGDLLEQPGQLLQLRGPANTKAMQRAEHHVCRLDQGGPPFCRVSDH
eukprot:10323658-Lingulodinium_polyedra.AAC.1